MRKRAAIDIGSNTVQLLVAESEANHFRPYLHALRTTRLGAGTQACVLAAERIQDTVAALLEYREILNREGVTEMRLIATSAVRDACNQALLLAAVREACGWLIRVLSGAEEARLSFLGAAGPYQQQANKSILLIDIGGGSTELIRTTPQGLALASADIGAVRAQAQAWDAATILQKLATAFVPAAEDAEAFVLGVGGTLTTAAGLLLKLQEYDREAVEGQHLTPAELQQLLARLQPLSVAERCAFSPLLVRRGEIICEGLAIAIALMQHLQLPGLTVSARGILEGCLLDWQQEEAAAAAKGDKG